MATAHSQQINSRKIAIGVLLSISLFFTSSCSFLEIAELYSLDRQNSNDLNLKEEREKFLRSSGLSLPSDISLVESSDSHGGFHGDGIYFLTFKSTEKAIGKYLNSMPWDRSWRDGPIHPWMPILLKDLEKYKEELSSSDIFFVVDSDAVENYPSHGRAIILIPSQKMILYSQWDS